MFGSETHPGTIFTHCPRCGKNHYVFDGSKSFTCADCGLVWFMNPAPAVAAILELPNGDIILSRRKFEPRAGTFDLPGGFVDPLESAEDAVRREIKEELNLDVNEMHFLASFPNEYVYKNISYFTCDLAFVCPIQSIEKMKADDDVSQAVVIKPQNINFEEISFPSIVNILRKYKQSL
jgi:ADP-ribose pyrophosphatase YjhB (NUDIX family)